MKNNMIIMKTKNIGKFVLSALVATTVSFASCSDWNDVESVNVIQPNIKDQNPALYAKYLENLKTYKNSDHKLVYAWFDNSEKTPFNRAQHLTEIPDSVDVVALMYPENLVERELKEIESIRTEKGTKVIYTVDFDAMKLIYDLRAKEQPAPKEGETSTFPDFVTFMVDSLNHSLSLADKYNYDGISISYLGKSMIHLTQAEKKIYIENQNVFMGMIKTWLERHTNKILLFEGQPQNLIDKTILEKCQIILLPALTLKNQYELTYSVALAKVEGVPTDRLGIKVSSISLDESDNKTGYFADGSRIIPIAAQWVNSAHDGYTIKGLGIVNINTDYYNPSLVYKYSRQAINTLNPSLKN